jgi:hypothetical protein
MKYANVLECKVRGNTDNTVPLLTDRHFISKLPPFEKKVGPQRWLVLCQKCSKRDLI